MYTNKEKEIYILPHSNLGVDPLEVRRKLTLGSKGELPTWIEEFNSAKTELEEAVVEEKIIAVAREAFKLKSGTDGGVTDAVVLEYLAHFLEWLSTPLEVKPKPSQKSQPCTGCR